MCGWLQGIKNMGLDLTIISNHKFNEELGSLKDKVLAELEFEYHDTELKEYFRNATKTEFFRDWKKDSWEFDLMGLKSLKEAIQIDNCICFKGPWALSLRFGIKSYHLNSNLRWRCFLQNELIQNRILKLMDKMNKVFESEFNIYIPDNGTKSSGYSDLVTENFELKEILIRMKNEIGEPCSSIEELRNKFEFNENAYLKI